MESALTPREIQARIRAGESVTSVAQVAGVSAEDIDVFAGPVLAERQYAVTVARASQVNKSRDPNAQRLLSDVVTDALTSRGVDEDSITWDAWRDENRQWTVQVSWPSSDGEDGAETHNHAEFDFDIRRRHCTPRNSEAKDLIGASAPPAPSPSSSNPDSEPTIDLNDELAIVRVVQSDSLPPKVLPDVPSSRIIKLPESDLDDTDSEDYADPELEKHNGIYTIVPNPDPNMDVLYDMLSGFNEDSVRIYTGLTQPVNPPPDPEPEASQQTQPDSASTAVRQIPHDPRSRRRELQSGQPASTPAQIISADDSTDAPDDHPIADSLEIIETETVVKITHNVTETRVTGDKADTDTKQATAPKAISRSTPKPAAQNHSASPAEPEQDALVEQASDADKTPPKPRKRRKRASVPTWDEIMFGATPPSDPSHS